MAKTSTNRKPKEAIPEGETKAQKFSRLASKRVAKALKAIQNVGNLSGPGYDYSEDQVNKIFNAIAGKSKAAYERFQAKGKTEAEDTFTV